ncbi:MAG TPA: HAMP domain-containing sensor histidine kinase [Candidatus Dormibacteraeota bacterium]
MNLRSRWAASPLTVRVQLLLYAFNLALGALWLPVILIGPGASPAGHRLLGILVLFGMYVALGVGVARQRFPVLLDLALVMCAYGVACSVPDPPDALGVLYFALWLRGLIGSWRRTLIAGAAFGAAFAASVVTGGAPLHRDAGVFIPQGIGLLAASAITAFLRENLLIGERSLAAEHALAERLQRESDFKSELLAVMSHELRTPLNSILGFAEILERDQEQLSPKQQRYVGHILTGGNNLLAIVNDALDLTEAEAGRIQIRPTDFLIDDPIRDAVTRLLPSAAERGVTVACHGEPMRVHADPLRTEQVILNLVSNAIKFTKAGGSVLISQDRVAQSVRVTVSDTGVGIPTDQLERIFEPFSQVDMGRSRTAQGTGLGLALTRRLVESMNGTLSVSSRVGEGSSFAFSLPAAGEQAG